MKTILYTLLISSFTFLGIAYIFQDAISQRIVDSNCADFNFYHMKLKICDDVSKKKFEEEKQLIKKDIEEIEIAYAKLESHAKDLQAALNSCDNTDTADVLDDRGKVAKEAFINLKPQLKVYHQFIPKTK